MKITVTEEMRKELTLFEHYDRASSALYANPKTRDSRRQHVADRDLRATGCRIARLVAEQIEEQEKEPLKPCESGSHDPSSTAHTWTCRCGRTVCTDCEGGSESDLCDACWERETP